MKCIKCGQEMIQHTMGKYRCPLCGQTMDDLVYRETLINTNDCQIVMSKEAYYEALNTAQESGKRMGYAQGRDETAREIFEDIEFYGVRSLNDKVWGNHFKLTDYTILDLKIKYGIAKEKGIELED